ncbi:hypothetical protein Tsp_15171, partial [Trichinella spiralis]|uniref:hypothetical protein n=1 Tax=Trichinella spiralis TaxID=6334 RepID=UPI0001EFE2A8
TNYKTVGFSGKGTGRDFGLMDVVDCPSQKREVQPVSGEAIKLGRYWGGKVSGAGIPEGQAPYTSGTFDRMNKYHAGGAPDNPLGELGPSGTGLAFSICHNCRMVASSTHTVQKSGGHLSHDAPCTLLGLHPLRKSLERTRRGQYDDEEIIVPAYQMDSFVKKL